MTTRTLTLLTDDLRQRADVRGMTTRHPDAELQRHLLQSIRALRSLVTRSGGSEFITSTSGTDTLPAAPPITGELYLEVPWPTAAVSIQGVDVLVNSRWYPLQPISFAARRDYVQINGAHPRAFCIQTLPVETPDTTLTAGVIQIYPLTTNEQTYRIWYLPEVPNISTGAHVINGHDGDWLEWVLWDATIKIVAEDDDVQNVDQIAVRERSVIQERIVAQVQRFQRAQAITPRRNRSYR